MEKIILTEEDKMFMKKKEEELIKKADFYNMVYCFTNMNCCEKFKQCISEMHEDMQNGNFFI